MSDYALQERRRANFNDSGMSEIAPAFQYGKRHAPADELARAKEEAVMFRALYNSVSAMLCAEKDCG